MIKFFLKGVGECVKYLELQVSPLFNPLPFQNLASQPGKYYKLLLMVS